MNFFIGLIVIVTFPVWIAPAFVLYLFMNLYAFVSFVGREVRKELKDQNENR